MGKFYQYDTRGASASDQIMTLERLLEEANCRIEDLEWENKGIEEWRAFGLDALSACKWQRERAEQYAEALMRLRSEYFVAGGEMTTREAYTLIDEVLGNK